MDLCRLQKTLSKVHISMTTLLGPVLVVVTDLAARLLGHSLFRRHFPLLLSSTVLFGPALSPWVSKHSIFANKNHYLYRLFLRSCWGWTCIFTGSFLFLLTFSIRPSLILSLRHLSRLAATGLLWSLCRHLLSLLLDASGSCYEPLRSPPGGQGGPGGGLGPGVMGKDRLLLFREGQGKAACLRAGLIWRGPEVSEDTLVLFLCCLVLTEEMAVFRPCLALLRPLAAPLRLLFLFCVALLALWLFLLLSLLAHFPQFTSQLLGGAVGFLTWKGLYQGWYRLGPSWYCPGLPGEGLLVSTDDGQDKRRLNMNLYHCNK
ncbi:fat storage-inducing transmembrane protein 1 [Chanos chanos]|uniref:Fat storage-inducing transmembrane protein 1 homolog n=1 Tax=Chanos chanos TaxID=29144 RepID=A0A6J2URF0_CHACN|nr:fat storage-inducing transmembrane protein 1 [Chanos chanos]